MAAALWLLRERLFAAPLHGLLRFGALAALIGAGMLVYGVAAQLTGAYDLREVGRMMARRRNRAATPVAAKTTTNEV